MKTICRSLGPTEGCHPCTLMIVGILAFSVSSAQAERPTWKTVFQSRDGQGRIEVDLNSISRDAFNIQVWLRTVSPSPHYVQSNIEVNSRFYKSLLETNCVTGDTKYLRTILLSTPNGKEIAEDGPYETFELGTGSPLSAALGYTCKLPSKRG
jgi:hypothetical protein